MAKNNLFTIHWFIKKWCHPINRMMQRSRMAFSQLVDQRRFVLRAKREFTHIKNSHGMRPLPSHRHFTSIWILILAGLSFSSHFSHAFVLLSGPEKAILPVKLAAPNITFIWNGDSPFISGKSSIGDGSYASASDADVMAYLLQRSLNRWSTVRGSYLKLILGNVDPSINIDSEDGVYAIVVGKQDSLSSAASARPQTESGTVIDCDIEVGTNPVSAKSLEVTLTHEIGHCVGLGHAHSNYGAIMGYSRAQTSPDLGADDKAGVIFLYPDPAFGSDNLDKLSCGQIGSFSQPSLIIGVLVIPMAFCYRRKKRRYL